MARLSGLFPAVICLALIGSSIADSAEIVQSSNEVVGIEVGKGALVRLDDPAASVFIAEPEIADIQVKSPRLFYVFGVRPGETTLYAVDEQDRILLNRRISVTHNLSRLQRAVGALLPKSEVKIHSIEGAIVLSGLVPTAADSETVRKLASQLVEDEANVINRLSVEAPSQINLQVRVAEVRRDVVKQLGINWSTLTTTGDFAFGLLTENPLAVVADSFFVGSHTKEISGGSTTASLFIDALEREDLLNILAEPNLTTISGETATFLAGGEFPIAVTADDEIEIEFKEFGVILAFTPTLVGENRISLRVRPEVSELSTAEPVSIAGFTFPTLTTRRAETTVELGSGQSILIAGMLQNNVQHNISKFPWLGDLPILGTLFRSDSFRRNETELMIMVTPYIVQPISTRIAAPTDGYVPPNDFERYVLNRRYLELLPAAFRVPLDHDGVALIGPAGFVLE